jgi:POLQ-like helicase
MKPERESNILLATTRARAKMHEYRVAERDFNRIVRSPAQLFSLTIGILGDVAAGIVGGQNHAERLSESRQHLLFCARFFDAYFESRLEGGLDSYMLLLASTTYYLAQFPGSAAVVADLVPTPCRDVEARGLEELLAWILKAHFENDLGLPVNTYGDTATVATLLREFYSSGAGMENLRAAVTELRRAVYEGGTARELLLSDLIGAVVQARSTNSTWSTLPRYSDVDRQTWAPILRKASFIRELWPAQHLLGTSGLYRGTSAVVQMPTSAGKTRALDLIVRGAFYSGRTSLAIVVAPFRALCEEIRQSLTRAFAGEDINVDELSDVQRPDFEIATFLSRRQVLVMTPEKCLYLMRHSPELANGLGLLIYDEGHQFDSDRGVTYELLITALKAAVPTNAQTVLISAVLSNARAIADWLLGAAAPVVSGTNLLPTARALAFVSWQDALGRLEFVEPANPDLGEFFVPRLIEQQALRRLGRERNERVFPERDATSIGLYLALRVAGSGGVAVFAGTKLTAASIARKAIDIYQRGFDVPSPVSHSDAAELRRLVFQSEANLGSSAPTTEAARLGIFSHHGNTPQGIRLAVEHAMKEGLVRMVICTSTLAQGVNLPIRFP